MVFFMKLEKLTENENRLIHNPKDKIYIRIIKGCSIEELKEFDKCKPINLNHYNSKQLDWIKTDKYFLREKLHHEPSELELITDLQKSHLMNRYKAFYVLKYPHMVD